MARRNCNKLAGRVGDVLRVRDLRSVIFSAKTRCVAAIVTSEYLPMHYIDVLSLHVGDIGCRRLRTTPKLPLVPAALAAEQI